MSDWEDFEPRKGAYLGWGAKAGQQLTGRVTHYDPEGGEDFNQNTCPHLVVELTETAFSVNKEGERRDFDAGETVNLTVGQASLKDQIRRASPAVGDLIRIELEGTEKTSRGNTVKQFNVRIKRGEKKAAETTAKPATQASAWDDAGGETPPF